MAMLRYSDEAARQLEAIYSSADVVAQRKATLDRLRLVRGEAVIDIGCGPGFLCEQMAEVVGSAGRVLGIDVSEDILTLPLEDTRTWLTYELGDAFELKVPNAAFDVAVSAQVLEYVDDVDRAIAEMSRVLKPGGRALIMNTDWVASAGIHRTRSAWRRSERRGKHTALIRAFLKRWYHACALPGSALRSSARFQSSTHVLSLARTATAS